MQFYGTALPFKYYWFQFQLDAFDFLTRTVINWDSSCESVVSLYITMLFCLNRYNFRMVNATDVQFVVNPTTSYLYGTFDFCPLGPLRMVHTKGVTLGVQNLNIILQEGSQSL